jgi:thioredoxin-dependent peroxiredoxin
MKISKPVWITAAAAVLVTVGVLAAPSEGSIPQLGTLAPDFTLASQDGSPVNLHSLRGRWVVLYFYPKDGTTGCTIEAHNFQRDLAQYEVRNAMIVGVSVDTTGSHQDFCAKQGLTFKLLADQEKKVSVLYGSLKSYFGFKLAARNTFLIDPEGKVARLWTGVSPSKHSQEVLQALSKFTSFTTALN